MSAGTVLVYSERPDVARELLAAARSSCVAGTELVALQLCAPAPAGAGALLAHRADPAAGEAEALLAPGADRVASASAEARALLAHGADRVLSLTGVPPGDAQALTAALAQAVALVDPGVVLLGATREGAEVAARLAQRLRAACAHRCTALSLDGDGLVVERGTLGRFVARQRLLTRPALATVAPRRFEPLPADPARRGPIETHVAAPRAPSSVRVLRSRPRALNRVEIERARVVVAIGRGLRRPEDLEVVANLARALGGEVGASRPLTDHLQWLPADVKVGLSGHTVRPDLYVACGISGQLEHLVGMREARVVVAINVDPAAPIFGEADYRVVGDLYAVVPALARALAALSR